MQSIFPWQQQTWQYLVARKNASQLPHAILLKGMNGIGKSAMAKSLAELLLCQKKSTTDAACGECGACQLLQAGSHPDLIIIEPEESGKAIKIDQIREMIVDLNNTSHQGGYKVVIIEAADLLNTAAANSLLKTLEEPDPHTVIILTSSRPMVLPATIRSRCQMIAMQTPEYSVAAAWLMQQLPDADIKLLLSLTENAPLTALNLVEDGGLSKRNEFFTSLYELQRGKISSIQMAKHCLDLGLENLLVTLMYIVSDLIKIKSTAAKNIVNQDQLEILAGLAKKAELAGLFAYKDSLFKLRQSLVKKINLNQQLLMENLIINWIQLFV